MPEIIVKLGDSIVQKNIFVKESIRIGRVPDNEIVVENLAVSRYHAVIEYTDDRYILTDLDSSNGTFVNGVRIKKTELQDRDVITIGKHKLYFYDQRAVAEAKPRASVVDIERTMLMDQQTPPPQAELEIVKGRQKGTRFVINGAQTSIGRGSFNEIQLTDWFVSKMHAVIERRGSDFIIRDLGSWRHTYVNGLVVRELPLADGDVIQMGPTVQLSFNLVRQEQPLPSTARVPVELEPGSASAASQAGMPVPEAPGAEQDEVTEQRMEPAAAVWDASLAAILPHAPALTRFPGEPVHEATSPFDSMNEPAAEAADAPPAASAPPVESEAPAPEPIFSQAPPHSQAEQEPEEETPVKDHKLSALEELEQALAMGPKNRHRHEPARKPVKPVERKAAPPPRAPAPKMEPIELGLDDELDLSPAAAERDPSATQPMRPMAPLTEPPAAAVPEIPAAAPEIMAAEPEGPMAPEVEPPACEASETLTTPETVPATAAAPPEAPAQAPAPATPAPAAAPAAASAQDPEQEIRMWERALGNKNPIIRKQAARQLLRLTGKTYDYS